VLGLALGLAPAGAWVAVRGSLSPKILLLTGAVLLWVAGFDVLYACQDMEHDRRAGLFSIPARFGLKAAFWTARVFHLAAFLLLLATVWGFGLGPWAVGGVMVVGLLLLYEHRLVSPGDLSRLNAAFFTMNGVIATVFFLFVATDLLVKRVHF
jgi:4-hydroxybenzoate polyprenyltransferase